MQPLLPLPAVPMASAGGISVSVAGGGLNDARQRHPSVPSSNQPPVAEWANSFWYMIRIGALQANAGLDDNAAAHIVNFMASMAVVIPCPDCRADYAKDWVLDPFTMAHAKSAERAVAWVEDLRRKVERHVEEQRRAKGITLPPGAVSLLPPGAPDLLDAVSRDDPPSPSPSPAPAPVPAPAESHAAVTGAGTAAGTAASWRALLGPMPPRRRRALAGVLRGSQVLQGPGATMAEDGTHPPGRPNPAAAQLRAFALRSALQVTAANNSGRRMGCACPVKRK